MKDLGLHKAHRTSAVLGNERAFVIRKLMLEFKFAKLG